MFKYQYIQNTILKHYVILETISFVYTSKVQIKALIADIAQDINGQHNQNFCFRNNCHCGLQFQ